MPTHVLLAEAINLTELAGSDFEETETETETSPFADPSLETRVGTHSSLFVTVCSRALHLWKRKSGLRRIRFSPQ